MGHENAQMVYEVYAAWIEEMNNEQVEMLNKKVGILKQLCSICAPFDI